MCLPAGVGSGTCELCVCGHGWALKVGGLGVAGHPEPMGLRVCVYQGVCCEVNVLHSTVTIRKLDILCLGGGMSLGLQESASMLEFTVCAGVLWSVIQNTHIRVPGCYFGWAHMHTYTGPS